MKGEKNILSLLSYVALIIVGILIVINTLLPLIGVSVSGPFFNVISSLKDLFVLIVVGLSAYNFTVGKKKGVKIIFWIAVVLYVAGAVLVWF